MQDIHDIRPPVTVGLDPAIIQAFFLVVVFILIAVALFLGIRRFLRNRLRKDKDMLMLPEPLPPYEAAIKELENLVRMNLKEQRQFYFFLTAILRRYIGRSFHFNGTEMTSQEFLQQINKTGMKKETILSISGFLTASDEYKYAGAAPERERVAMDCDLVGKLVESVENNIALAVKGTP